MQKILRNIFIVSCTFFGVCNISAQTYFDMKNKETINNYEVVAEVGDIKITAEEFFYSYEFGPAFPKRKSDSKETHLKYLINEKLLALESYKEGLINDEEVSSLFDDIQADLATEEMFKDEILSKMKIDSAAVDTILHSKQVELELKWLYSHDEEGIKAYWLSLYNNVSFDSIFVKQFNDSVFLDMRSLRTTFYSLRKNNPLLAQIVDTMEAGHYSAPIHVNSEWYIVKLENIWRDMITSETELNKLRYESEQAFLKNNMDRESDNYVDNLLRNENPIIKKHAFNFLRAYLGKYILPSEQYEEWELEKILESALSNLGLIRGEEYTGVELVVTEKKTYLLDEFITWYRNRSHYIKFDKSDINSFSRSIENLIWLMLRDKLLTQRAKENGYFENNWVKTQSNWWRDKIAYSAMRNKLANSILLANEEVNTGSESEPSPDDLSIELIAKMFRTIQASKAKYDVVINSEVLNRISVSEENDPKVVDFYSAKKGGLIPRPPYPTIDNEWVNWE